MRAAGLCRTVQTMQRKTKQVASHDLATNLYLYDPDRMTSKHSRTHIVVKLHNTHKSSASDHQHFHSTLNFTQPTSTMSQHVEHAKSKVIKGYQMKNSFLETSLNINMMIIQLMYGRGREERGAIMQSSQKQATFATQPTHHSLIRVKLCSSMTS